MCGLIGIFENKSNDGYYWMNYLDEYEINEAKYFLSNYNQAGCHACEKSAYWGDIEDGYIDTIQNEYDLKDGELYVVVYYVFEDKCWSIDQLVDFGITKHEIIENVKNQKYREGASYYTMGQMFYETKKVLNEQGGKKGR